MTAVVAWVCCAASLFTFVAFGWDKRRALTGERRIPEKVLHFGALLGGWPGTLIGARVFRHKTRKLSFRLVTGAIVALHGALAWLVWSRG